VSARDVVEADDEEPRLGEQRRGQRDLRRGQGGAQTTRATGHGSAAGLRVQPSGQTRAHALNRWHEAENEAGRESDAHREQQHGCVDLKVQHRHVGRRHQRQESRERGACHGNRAHASKGTQDERLDDQQAHQLARRGAERQPHGDLGRALGTSGQEQVGDVDCGDRQHEPGHGEQHDHDDLRFFSTAVTGAGAVVEEEPSSQECVATRSAQGSAHHRKLHVARQRGQAEVGHPLGLLARHTGREPRRHVQPVIVAGVEPVPVGVEPCRAGHGQRREDLRRIQRRRAAEALGRDTHDSHRLPVHDDRRSNDGRVGAEACRPVGVAEDDHGMAALDAVVLRSEQTAQRRTEPESGEVGAGHENALGRRALPGKRHAGAEVAMSVDAREAQSRFALQILEEWVADYRCQPAAVARRLVSGPRARDAEVHQLLGSRHRKAAKEQALERREDGAVDADAERQRDHGDAGDEGTSQEAPDRVSDVMQEIASHDRTLTVKARASEAALCK
jgi:hypothetical protein